MENVKNEKINRLRRKPHPQCPFIQSFFAGCHCTDMTSIRIEEAIYYCGANYDKCSIYRSLKEKNSVLILDSLQKEDLI